LKLPSHMLGSGAIMGLREPSKMEDPYEGLHEESGGDWHRNVWDYMPMRNSMILSVAASYVWSVRANRLYTGFQFDEPEWDDMNERDYQGFDGCDTSPAYLDAFNDLLLNGGLPGEVNVEAPFLDWRWAKDKVVKTGVKLLGDKKELARLTYSCEFGEVCGACRGCLMRKKLEIDQSIVTAAARDRRAEDQRRRRGLEPRRLMP